MRKLLLLLAITLVIIWAVVFFVFGGAGIVHILPVIAVAITMKGLTRKDELVYYKKNSTWKVRD